MVSECPRSANSISSVTALECRYCFTVDFVMASGTVWATFPDDRAGSAHEHRRARRPERCGHQRHIRPASGPSEATGERGIDGVTSTLVAPRTVADGNGTRLPSPEVTGLRPGSAASTTRRPPAAADAADQTLEAATASLSVDGCYRWSLTRRWATGPDSGLDHAEPEPGRRCYRRPDAAPRPRLRLGGRFGQLVVTNLYGWRSPSPSVLRRVADQSGDK